MRLLLRNVNYEILAYFGVYIAYLLYGLRNLFAARDEVLDVAKYDFAGGWKIIGRPRDDSNDELENFTSFIRDMWPCYILHVVVCEYVRHWWPQRQSSAHTAVCVLSLAYTLKPLSLFVCATLLCSYYALARTNSKRPTWILSALWMIAINIIKESDYFYTALGYGEYFTLIITLSWFILRCSSFIFNRVNDQAAGVSNIEEIYSAEHFFGYTLYFPTLVYGPFLGYKRYAVILHQPRSTQQFRTRCVRFGWEALRVAFWWSAMQIALHYLYVHYMARDVAAVRLVGTVFGQHAAGYFMGQFFFLYYVITYGLGIAFARFDGLNPPHRPRCIGRIHFYSDMWKYFDEGLYEFLFHHIYAQLCGLRSSAGAKMFATAATFAFVFVWHGCYSYILIWSALNFGCLVAEKCFKNFSHVYMGPTKRLIGESGAVRLRALFATQLFIPAAFSNVYFVSGMDVGNFLMRGAYMSGVWNYIALTLCSYCFFQCSEFILNSEKYVD